MDHHLTKYSYGLINMVVYLWITSYVAVCIIIPYMVVCIVEYILWV